MIGREEHRSMSLDYTYVTTVLLSGWWQEFSVATVLDVLRSGLLNNRAAAKNSRNNLEKNIRLRYLTSFHTTESWTATLSVSRVESLVRHVIRLASPSYTSKDRKSVV